MTATATDFVPAAIAARWGLADAAARRLAGGLINQTFALERDGQPVAVLQRLHPIFAPEVNLDIEALTRHLAARGLATPRLVRTLDGAAWASDGAHSWRALSWVAGRCVARVPDERWAEAGGELVGRFHRALADFSHSYHFSRGDVHDTAAHLAKLRARLDAPVPPPGGDDADEVAAVLAQARGVGAEIMAMAARLPALPTIPRRHCHGDLKISNLLFDDAEPVTGHCLVDLDTIGMGTMAFELGDAMRSWCNPKGEDEQAAAFELPLFAAAMRGVRRHTEGLLSAEERRAIVTGLHTVCIELAARFCVDVFDDRYFGWDAAQHRSRRHHNLVRARSQLSLARSVASQLAAAHAVV